MEAKSIKGTNQATVFMVNENVVKEYFKCHLAEQFSLYDLLAQNVIRISCFIQGIVLQT